MANQKHIPFIPKMSAQFKSMQYTISGQRHVEIAFRDGTKKEFDWESTGHQECWTPEARERKRQMMLERWAKQKCQR